MNHSDLTGHQLVGAYALGLVWAGPATASAVPSTTRARSLTIYYFSIGLMVTIVTGARFGLSRVRRFAAALSALDWSSFPPRLFVNAAILIQDQPNENLQ